ncbi:MAG: peroxidase-related enzyme [Flavobacteriales bacterium]|nr:peroxidase-related enzyme [Flavobacteriales bacterium]
MSWINEISYEAAEGRLKKLYEQVKGPDNNIDNILSIHSLRPHTLTGHMALYKNVLHNSANTLPKWYLETLGIYVSFLNACSYCVTHHLAGMKRELGDDQRAHQIHQSILNDNLSTSFEGKELAGLEYGKKLTLSHKEIKESDIAALRKAGFEDGEILEVNQVVSYFNYVNRTVLGLGVNTNGDVIGLSPGDSDDVDNWSHR